jgi:hypothetical protein
MDSSPHSFLVFGSKPPRLDLFHHSHPSTTSTTSIAPSASFPSPSQHQSSSYHPTRQNKQKAYLQEASSSPSRGAPTRGAGASLNPYLTPIVNDPLLVATQTKLNKAFKSIQRRKEKEKKLAKARARGERGTGGGTAEQEQEAEDDDLALAPSDFFECYLAHEMVTKIQKCWKILESFHPHLHQQFLTINTSLLGDGEEDGEVGFRPSFLTEGGRVDQGGQVQEEGQGDGQERRGIEMELSFVMTGGGGEGGNSHHPPLSAERHQIPGLKLGSLPWSPMNSQSFQQTTNSVPLASTDPLALALPSSLILTGGAKSDLFQSTLDDTALPIPVMNETLRKTLLSQDHTTLQSASLASSSSLKLSQSTYQWTPHEIALQKVVQKRGGELYIITAASTKGRMKAPYRRNRYLRLLTDLEHVNQQIALLEMSKEEYHSWQGVSDHLPSPSSLTGKYLTNLLHFHNNTSATHESNPRINSPPTKSLFDTPSADSLPTTALIEIFITKI